MPRAMRALLAVLVLLVACAGVSQAKPTAAPPPPGYKTVPNGNYTTACTGGRPPAVFSWHWNGKLQIMNATCKQPGSTWPLNSILYYETACAPGSDIIVLRGYVRCSKINSFKPVGTFKASCRSIVWNAYSQTLQANCINSAYDFKPVELFYGEKCKRGSTVSATRLPALVCDTPRV